VLNSPPEFGQEVESEAESHNPKSASEGEAPKRTRCERRSTHNSNDFRVDIPEFEGKPNREEVLDWLST